MTKTIDFYFCLNSPWVYLGQKRLEEIAKNAGAAIDYHPVDLKEMMLRLLGTDDPPERSDAHRKYGKQEMQRWADFRGLTISEKPRYYPVAQSRAARLVIAAQRFNADPGPLVFALPRAVWAEDRNINDPDTLKAIADVKGLRMRAPNPPTQALLAYLGATPVGMPPGQVYENLQKGVIDGAVFPWDAIKGFRLENSLKHHLDARVYTACFHLVMNPQRFAALPAEVRKAVDGVIGDALVERFGGWWNKWDQAGLDAVKPLGHDIVSVPDAQREAWRAELKPVIDGELAKLEKAGIGNARAIYDEMRGAVAKYR